ncbi:hypothetical protein [Falsiroseomonas selenitidurans]|uniref:Uncharacterized protein n=1 Tax=Falsiroseomonas selenitidurans TaxID=2716335 RepID=A0ABX1E896_9PROT|nr:hypothetical protein [Falsiroseomonas selenitidurans]NKC31732.1 hypothetical protein [Falsiroseomonas selenitidurans]
MTPQPLKPVSGRATPVRLPALLLACTALLAGNAAAQTSLTEPALPPGATRPAQAERAPRGDDTQAPRGDDTQAPRGDDTQAPRGDDTQAPRADDTQVPREQPGIARGVVPPPPGIDPGIQGSVPEPTPNTTPVIPPPGTPQGAPGAQPR